MLRTFGIHHRLQFPQLYSTSDEPVLQYHLRGWVHGHLWLIGEHQHSDQSEGSRLFATHVVIMTSTWFESPVGRRDEGADVEIDK